MAKVTFIGDPREGADNPPACQMFGMIFPLNMTVDVEDEQHLVKLRGNSHFEVEGEAKRRRGRPPKEKSDGGDAELIPGEPETSGTD